MHGFARLIEKDWLTVGHKFSDRLRADSLQLSADKPPKADQVSPIFLQFIECVWQLTQQYPFAFEFGETFLTDLYEEAMIGRFATFLYNTDHDRRSKQSKWQVLWRYLLSSPEKYRNPFFEGDKSDKPDPVPDFLPRQQSKMVSLNSSAIRGSARTESTFGGSSLNRQSFRKRAGMKTAAQMSHSLKTNDRIEVKTKSSVTQCSMLGADPDPSVSPANAELEYPSSSPQSKYIMPLYQPHNLHIWYGFFQRYSQGMSSMASKSGTTSNDAFVLNLSTRIRDMEEEIRSLKQELQAMKTRSGEKSGALPIGILESLDERTRGASAPVDDGK